MAENILQQIKSILTNSLGIDVEKVNMETTFNDLGMDSLDAMALLNELEMAYDIRLPNEEILKIRTIGQAVKAMETYAPQA